MENQNVYVIGDVKHPPSDAVKWRRIDDTLMPIKKLGKSQLKLALLHFKEIDNFQCESLINQLKRQHSKSLKHKLV